MRNLPFKMDIFRSDSEAETLDFGLRLGEKIADGLCICVTGPLGAGKTVLVKGICKGLGIKENILSPTFILYEEFKGRLPVVHIDLYRMEHEKEIEELGVFDKLGTGSVILAEWGDRSSYLYESSDVVINISFAGEREREIEVLCSKELEEDFSDINSRDSD